MEGRWFLLEQGGRTGWVRKAEARLRESWVDLGEPLVWAGRGKSGKEEFAAKSHRRKS